MMVTPLAACMEVVEPAANVGQLDGKTIFRGLFFGDAPVGQMLPEIWSRVSIEDPSWTDEQRQALASLKQELIAEMERADPTFFERFRVATTSGDHVRIKRALAEGGAHLTTAAKVRMESERLVRGDALGAAVQFYFAIHVAAFYDAAAVVTKVLVVTAAAVVCTRNTDGDALLDEEPMSCSLHDQGGTEGGNVGDSQLQLDRFVQQIATRLKN
jgi:SdpC family antimicrobial peptide